MWESVPFRKWVCILYFQPNVVNGKSNFELHVHVCTHTQWLILTHCLGYVEGTFDLVWRRQDDTTGEDEVELDRCSTATLYELNMPEEPKKAYVLIREKDEKLPERIQKVI